MRVVKPSRIREFGINYPDAANSLRSWLEVARKAHWRNLHDVRRVYPHADVTLVASGNEVTIFNIRGNKYRLLVAIKYQWGMIYVLRFLSHKDYDDRERKRNWKDEL